MIALMACAWLNPAIYQTLTKSLQMINTLS